MHFRRLVCFRAYLLVEDLSNTAISRCELHDGVNDEFFFVIVFWFRFFGWIAADNIGKFNLFYRLHIPKNHLGGLDYPTMVLIGRCTVYLFCFSSKKVLVLCGRKTVGPVYRIGEKKFEPFNARDYG